MSDSNTRMMSAKQKSNLSLKQGLKYYIAYCDQVVDYNYPIPKIVEIGSDDTCLVRGKIENVRKIEEPSLRGLLKWLESDDE